MEIISTSKVNSFEINRKQNALFDSKILSKNMKENFNNSASFKADSLIPKKKIKKTKIKMQEKTKEFLAFDNNTFDSNSNADSNLNNFENNDRKNLNKLQEQNEKICLNSTNKMVTQLDSNLNKECLTHDHKMIVHSFQMNHSIKNAKPKKSKKNKKKKIIKSLNFRHPIVDQTNQNDTKNTIEIDFNSIKNNESIRWENELLNEKEEAERIELYKINRRKRYIEQKNKIFKTKLQKDLACDFSSSSSSTCSMENINSKNFQSNLENIVEVDKMDNKNTVHEDKEANVLVKDRNKSSSGCIIVKREKETDSAISSISSNSQMFY